MTDNGHFTDANFTSGEEPSGMIFICKGKEAYARGKLPPEGRGFIVLAGSRVVHRNAPSLQSSSDFLPYYKMRVGLIEDGIIAGFTFTRDTYFRSPSAASSVVLGKPSNGKKDWKTSDGRPLGAFI